MDHKQRIYSGEQYAQLRPEELSAKYTNIKDILKHYDNLPTALKHFHCCLRFNVWAKFEITKTNK